MAVEIGRRSLDKQIQPTADELEENVKTQLKVLSSNRTAMKNSHKRKLTFAFWRCMEGSIRRFCNRYDVFVFGFMDFISQDEEVIIATTRFFRDPYKAGVPKSTPVEQKDGHLAVW